MAALDDVTDMLEEMGEQLVLNGTPLPGIFNEHGEVVIEGLVSQATTALVAAAAGAAKGQTLTRGATDYRVNQPPMPQSPDGALHLLVLVKV